MDKIAIQIVVNNSVIHSGVSIKRHTPVYINVNVGNNYGVLSYPTMFLNPLTGRLVLRVPTSNYENRFAVRNGHLMLIQS